MEPNLEQWIQGSQQLSNERVQRFLAIEASDPGWSRDHDDERAVLIDELHQLGHRREARALVHRWLLGYRDRLVITPSRKAARRPLLWRCLADVVERTSDQHLLSLFWQITALCQLPSNDGHYASLPLLGIPILNRFDLLERLLESLDHPVEVLALVDNSGGEGDLSSQLRTLQNEGHPLINSIEIAKPFRNLGVAASWNCILTSFNSCSPALLANNDIQFSKGAIASALEAQIGGKACFTPFLPKPQSYSAFLINHLCWNTTGLFDEGFYPAYCEDLAHQEQLDRHPDIQIIELTELQKQMAECNNESSATIGSDSKLDRFNQTSFQLNRLWLLSQQRHLNPASGGWQRRWLADWSED